MPKSFAICRSLLLLLLVAVHSHSLAGTPVLCVNIGHSSKDESVRNIGRGIPSNGWYHSQVDDQIEEWAAAFKKHGYPLRLELHNPWGCNQDEPMDFDQRIEAADNPKLHLAVLTFPLWLESRVKPLIGDDGECILYLGTIRADKDMVELQDDPAAYKARVAEAMQDIPDWCSVGFDSVNELTKEHPAWPLLDAARHKYKHVYIEPRPAKTSDMLGFNVISGNAGNWFRTDPETFPELSNRLARTSDIQGERLVRPRSFDVEERREFYRRILEEGSTPLLFSIDDLDLLAEVDKEVKTD